MSGRVTPTPTPPPKGCELICDNVFEDPDPPHSSDEEEELLKRREPTMLRRGKKLVAPQAPDAARHRRYTLVLDLDETVVYARDGPLYTRAYLRDFLDAIKDQFEVIIWTAGDREYAKNVLAGINVGHVVDHLIYRHKKWFNGEDYTKDLSQLGRDLNHTVIIENTPDCVRQNPGNGIIVEDFEVPLTTDTDAEDREATPPPSAPASSSACLQESAESAEAAESPRRSRGGSAAVSSSTPAPAPLAKPKRVTTDRTLLLLREVLEALAKSGQTVPVFLSRCELLSKQTVVGCDGQDIPIYYLGTRRRRSDAGSPRKSVKANRDRASASPARGSSTSPDPAEMGGARLDVSERAAVAREDPKAPAPDAGKKAPVPAVEGSTGSTQGSGGRKREEEPPTKTPRKDSAAGAAA